MHSSVKEHNLLPARLETLQFLMSAARERSSPEPPVLRSRVLGMCFPFSMGGRFSPHVSQITVGTFYLFYTARKYGNAKKEWGKYHSY